LVVPEIALLRGPGDADLEYALVRGEGDAPLELIEAMDPWYFEKIPGLLWKNLVQASPTSGIMGKQMHKRYCSLLTQTNC